MTPDVPSAPTGPPGLEDEVARLRARVDELTDVLNAAAAGELDAVVLGPPGGERVYALDTAERPYRLIVENMSEGAATVSERGTVLYLNHRMSELLGSEAHTLVGGPADQLVRPVDRPTLQHLLGVVGRTTARAEVTLAGRSPRPVSLSAAAIGVDGTLVRCLVATDLTPQKRAEAELEARVAERTRELRLLNAQLEGFSYSVAHDLRGPLRAINGFCGILRDDYGAALGDEGRDLLQRVETAAVRMGELIDALLVLSRTGRTAVEPERVDLSAIATEVAATLAAGEPGRAVRVAVQPGLVAVGDRSLLRSVLANLLENAWKFTRTVEEPSIEVGGNVEGGEARYFVRDNGVGFDMSQAGRLFQPFQRLQQASTYEGSGIGLAIVSSCVAQLGGRVWCESTPGAGATFWFTTGAEPAPTDGPP